MKSKLIVITLLAAVCSITNGCKKGCVECTGITAPRTICEDDYTESGDYDNEVNAYEAAGGVCED